MTKDTAGTLLLPQLCTPAPHTTTEGGGDEGGTMGNDT